MGERWQQMPVSATEPGSAPLQLTGDHVVTRVDWYDAAEVRSGQRLTLSEGDHASEMFPRALMPVLRHQRLDGVDPARLRRLQAHHLYSYLQFTTHLEVRVVNRATASLAAGRCGFTLPNELRKEAFRIYVDEGYHALSSFDVLDQVSRYAGIEPLPYDFGPVLRRLDSGAHVLGSSEHGLLELLQVVVFETLVTSMLRDIPRDESVMPLVRNFVSDHARDEVWHHAFFASFFRELWTHLTPAERERSARVLPTLIDACVLPHVDGVTDVLRASGLDSAAAEEIARETYTSPQIIAELRGAARRTLSMFRGVGVFDIPGVTDAFESAGYDLQP